MATNTYVALDKVTVSTAVSSVTLSSIPQTYTDLVLVMTAKRLTGGTTTPRITYNGSSTGYSETILSGDGTTASSSRTTSVAYLTGTSAADGTWPTSIFNIMSYTAPTYKTTLISNGYAASTVARKVGLWQTTTAISSITITSSSTSFDVGSTFSLYGIAAASVGAKATGGIISSDADYWYHTFLSSGTFTPTQSITADVLVVAGGGGGGNFSGGGGGAGGLLTFTSQSLSATGYTCTVGAGGAGGASSSSAPGAAGSNSQFGALTACVGGGAGAGRVGGNGSSGGSGGGNANRNGATYSGTSGQGYAGGGGSGYGGHGGGGAGGVGQNNGDHAGAGGIGATSSLINAIGSAINLGQLSSGNYYFAGGGGGHDDYGVSAAGGIGGGGTGNSTNGTVNLGGGGGAGSQTPAAGSGGSGIVIVRYAKV